MAFLGLLILLVVAGGTAWAVYAVTRRSLRSLLDGVVRRSAATEFYLRSFAICLFFSALVGVLDSNWNPASGKPLMEHVWAVANVVYYVLVTMLVVLVCFMFMITIVVAALGRKSTEAPVCLECGYSLKGLVDDLKCPECGERYVGSGE